MNYEEWVLSVPEEIKGDSLWKMEAYRLLLTMVPQQRAPVLHEPKSIYQPDADEEEFIRHKLDNLLQYVPQPWS